MFDKLIAFHTLELIRDSLELIEKRCSDIYSVDDFLLSDSGMMKLDSVCIYKEDIPQLYKVIIKIINDLK
ncbi:hypothetical protein [Bacteroides intestinalis]|uniref:Toxin-antitoxin system, antitoxin component domain protein n=1 Tax=Bacteroides intestinalis TaxID=329854 RepID=A0A139LB39_9BACE|nr:hypothetical protein [Bacteroides intestinalis]KXT48621.1 toxin-antitoxin system, antitoxin component domain protein [Bacteroides intestinalis]